MFESRALAHRPRQARLDLGAIRGMDAFEEGLGGAAEGSLSPCPCSASSVADQWAAPVAAIGLPHADSGRLEREPHPLFGGVEQRLRLALGLRQVVLVDRAPDRLAEAGETILEQIVGGAALEHVDRGLLADAAGDDDERQIGIPLRSNSSARGALNAGMLKSARITSGAEPSARRNDASSSTRSQVGSKPAFFSSCTISSASALRVLDQQDSQRLCGGISHGSVHAAVD